jgi:TP901 family phage tail tape measure protein
VATSLGSAVLELKVDSAALKSGLSAAQKDVEGSLKSMGMAMTAAGAAGIAGFALASKAAISFDASIARTTGLTSASAEEMSVLREEVLKLAPAVGKGPLELSKALYFILSAGIPAADAMSVLEASAKAAAAGLGDTKVVADAVTSVLNAYKLSADQASHATDILTQIVTQGKVPPEELAGSLGKVIGTAAALGISFEEVGANIAVLTRVGLDASQATTALRATMSALLKPSSEMTSLMGELGMSMEDVRKKVLEEGLLATLQMMMEAVGGNTAKLAELFPNVRALTDVLSTVGSQGEKYVEVLAAMENASGLTSEAFGVMEATTSHKLASLKASFDVLLISVGAELEPAISDLAGTVQGFIAWLDKVPEPLRKIGVYGGVGASSMLLLAGMIDLTVLSVVKLTSDATKLITVLRGLAIIQALTPFLGPLGLAGALIGGAFVARAFSDEIDGLIAKIPVLGGLVEGPTTKLKEFSQAAKDLNLALEAEMITQEELTSRALPELSAQLGQAVQLYRDDLTRALGDVTLAEAALAGQMGEVFQATGGYNMAFIVASELTKGYTKDVNEAVDALLKYGYSYPEVRSMLIHQGVDLDTVGGHVKDLNRVYAQELLKGVGDAVSGVGDLLSTSVRQFSSWGKEGQYSAADLANYYGNDFVPYVEGAIRDLEAKTKTSFDDFRANFPDTITSADAMKEWLKTNLPEVATAFEDNMKRAEEALTAFETAMGEFTKGEEESWDDYIARLQQVATDFNNWKTNIQTALDLLAQNTDLGYAEMDAAAKWFIDQGPTNTRRFVENYTDPTRAATLEAVAQVIRAYGTAPGDMGQEFLAGKDDLRIQTELGIQYGILDPINNAGLGVAGANLARDFINSFGGTLLSSISTAAGWVNQWLGAMQEEMKGSPDYVTYHWGGGLVADLADGASDAAPAAAASMADITKAILESGVLGPLVGLGAQMKDTVELALTGLNDKIKIEEDYLADLDDTIEQVTESQQAWGDEVDRISGLLDAANDDLRRFTDAQIEGTGAYDDALFRLEIQMDKLKLKKNELEQQRLGLDEDSTQAKTLDDMIGKLEDQLDALGLKADGLRLEERIKFDPLQRQIDKLADTTGEMSFEDIIAGITKTQGVIEDLTDALAGATSQVEAHDAILKVLRKSEEYHQEILDGVKTKYEDLKQALEKIDPELAKIAGSMGEGYAEAMQKAFEAMEQGNVITAGEALGQAQQMFDDLQVLIEGSGQEQLVKPLGDVLADAQALVAGTFQIDIPAAVTAGEEPLRQAGAAAASGLMKGVSGAGAAAGTELAGGFIDAMGGAAAQLAGAGAGGGAAAASGLMASLEAGLSGDVKRVASTGMAGVVAEAKSVGEGGMPAAATATMTALQQGLMAFQEEAGQWGGSTMAWVVAGMFTYMAKDGRKYAQATGRTFIDGIIEGLNQQEGSLYGRITEIIEAAIASANAAAGAASPAKRFIEMGANFSRSLQAGWGQPVLNFGVGDLRTVSGRQVSQTFAPAITVHAQSSHPADIAREVSRALDTWWRGVDQAAALGV